MRSDARGGGRGRTAAAAAVVGAVAALAFAGAARAQTSREIRNSLAFPIEGMNPYTARITSVLDHDRTKWGIDGAGKLISPGTRTGTIVSWMGERARKDVDGPAVPYSGDASILGFGGDGPTYPKRSFLAHGGGNQLWYEKTASSGGYEHSGYDYGSTAGKIIVAPAAGTLYVVGSDPLHGETWKKFHTFKIDHGNGVSTWFLHAERFVSPFANPPDPGSPGDWDGLVKSVIGLDAYYGRKELSGEVAIGPVRKGEAVAKVGGFSGFAAHLHMEVRYRNADGATVLVDPYGWEGSSADPLERNPGYVLWEGFVRPDVTAAQLDARTGQVTVSGSGFSSKARVEIWYRYDSNRTDTSNKKDGTYVATCTTTTFVSSTRLVATGCGVPADKLDDYAVKVALPVNADTPAKGPRSKAFGITGTQPAAAVMLAPAPGSVLSGGTVLQWSDGAQVRQYWLDICCHADGRRVYPRASQGLRTSYALPLTGLPEDGRQLTVTLETEFLTTTATARRVYTYLAPLRPVTLRIDGGLSSQRAQGSGTFWFTGSGFQAGRAVRRYLKSGTTVTELTDAVVTASASGTIRWAFSPTCASPPGTYTVWAVDAAGKRSNDVTEIIQAGSCGDRWELRVFNSDDVGRARLNGAAVVSVGFMQDSGWRDVTASLLPGANRVVFDVENTGGGVAYGFEIRRNGALVYQRSCGTAGVVGCDNNRMFPAGIAYSFAYDIVK